MKKIDLILPLMVLISVVLACGSESKTEVEKSGRLEFVKKLRYGSVGTHGGQGWYVSDRYFLVDEKDWAPPGVKLDDLGSCYPGPNEKVEALLCSSFADNNETAYVLRMNADKPEWVIANDQQYGGGNNLGKWAGDGHWLVFKNSYFNVETSEKKEIKGMPDYPGNHFLAASPDLKTIVMDEFTNTDGIANPPGVDPDKENDRRRKASQERFDKGIPSFLLVDVESGKNTLLEFKEDKYAALRWDKTKFSTRPEWSKFVLDQLVWEKDKTGKDALVYHG